MGARMGHPEPRPSGSAFRRADGRTDGSVSVDRAFGSLTGLRRANGRVEGRKNGSAPCPWGADGQTDGSMQRRSILVGGWGADGPTDGLPSDGRARVHDRNGGARNALRYACGTGILPVLAAKPRLAWPGRPCPGPGSRCHAERPPATSVKYPAGDSRRLGAPMGARTGGSAQ